MILIVTIEGKQETKAWFIGCVEATQIFKRFQAITKDGFSL